MPLDRRSLRRALTAAENNADQLVRKVLLDAYAKITKKTPVDTGRAKGNWNISAGSPDLSVDDNASDDSDVGTPSNPPALPSQALDVYYISNNLPYIEVLENGGYPVRGGGGTPGPRGPSGPRKKKTKKPKRPKTTAAGFSVQAPEGMVKVTLQEITLELKAS